MLRNLSELMPYSTVQNKSCVTCIINGENVNTNQEVVSLHRRSVCCTMTILPAKWEDEQREEANKHLWQKLCQEV